MRLRKFLKRLGTSRVGRKALLPLLALCAISVPLVAQSQSYEVGYHYDYRGPAIFTYVSHDFHITDFGSVGLWFSPSVEVIVSRVYLEGWLQGQVLIDAPAFTISVRGKFEMLDNRRRSEFRIGLLLGR